MAGEVIAKIVLIIGSSIIRSLHLDSPIIRTCAVPGWDFSREKNELMLEKLLAIRMELDNAFKLSGTVEIVEIVLNLPGNGIMPGYRTFSQNGKVHYHKSTRDSQNHEEFCLSTENFLKDLIFIFPNTKITAIPPLPRRLRHSTRCEQCILYGGKKWISRYIRVVKKALVPKYGVSVRHWWEILAFTKTANCRSDKNLIDAMFQSWAGKDEVHLHREGRIHFGNLMGT